MAADIRFLAAAIAAEINARADQVTAAIGLIDEGATIPFIARYRKEVTGGLDDTQLRILSERLVYLRELAARRTSVIESITSQGKMTEELAARLAKAATKAELEDLYLPYKPKRRDRRRARPPRPACRSDLGRSRSRSGEACGTLYRWRSDGREDGAGRCPRHRRRNDLGECGSPRTTSPAHARPGAVAGKGC